MPNISQKQPTVLITGGAGYIGSHAVKLFLQKGYKVVVFDNFSRGYQGAVEMLYPFGKLRVVKGDLRNPADLLGVFASYPGMEAVLHFGALCLVDESMRNPALYFQNNVVGSLNLLEAMRMSGIRNIIFSSTCAVYGESQYLPVDEKHPTHPLNPYGESKLQVENMLRWYGECYEFNYAILRYFNVCGADSHGIIGDSKKPSQLLMQNAVRGAMGIAPFSFTCPKVDTPDHTPIRDYIDVEDLVEAHFSAFEYLEKGGKSDIFNLGNGTGYSVKQIVSTVEKVFGTKIKPAKAPARQGEYAQIYADPGKAEKVLGFKTHKTLQDSIESLHKWYKRFPEGYEN